MKVALPPGLLLAALSAPLLLGADAPEPRTNMKEALRARVAADAKKKSPPPENAPAAADAAQTPAPTGPAVPPAATPATAPPSPEPGKSPPAPPPAAAAPATVLPKVEVRKGRVTVLDVKLAQQEAAIEREKKLTKVSEVDAALNDSKIARPLAILGGDSAQFRQRVAAERVELMEAEKDLIEAIAHARTKEEKAELQKQLDELKAMRRQLDKSLRQ
jgi:hypothetical protein